MNRRSFIQNAIKGYGEDVFELNPWLLDILDRPEIELWRSVKDYEGMYEVSNYGRIKSFIASYSHKKQPVLFLKTDTFHPSGYRYVTFNKDDIRRTFAIHRLVACSFILNPNNLPQINHENTDKTCNEWWNLKWCTNDENMDHAIKNKLCVYNKGEKHGMSKITEQTVLEIREMHKTGKYTHAQLGRFFNLDRHHVGAIIRKTTWKHI